MIIESTLPDSARLWIYQINREISPDEEATINQALDTFLSSWNTHGTKLVAEAHLVDGRFIHFMVDEDVQYASGCSIDSSIHFLQDLGKQLNLDFFDRLTCLYEVDGDIQEMAVSELPTLYREGTIDESTVFYDNLIKTKGDLHSWKKPLAKSWHYKFID